MSNQEQENNYHTYGKGYRFDRNGWTYVHIEGEPEERGEQYGNLVVDKYKNILEKTKYMTYQTTGVPYEYFVKKAVELTKGKIPDELMAEMTGFAKGLTKAGFKSTVEDIIGWNAYSGITGYWWPNQGQDEYYKELLKMKKCCSDYFNGAITEGCPKPQKMRQGHCSAFVATGSATKDGKIVIGHETFDDFWASGMMNIILDMKPTEGARILMQTAPGYVMSMTDFFVCKSEEHNSCMVGLETTIIEFSTYIVDAIPEWVRVREAMQYGYSIEKWIEIMQKDNNGANPGSWLLGDIITNEIARFEQGYLFQNIECKKDGHFFGCNAVEDPRIRNIECTEVGYNDIRRQTGGRRTRWPQLLTQHNGSITAEIGQRMLADTYDVYLKQDVGGANTICSMYDNDPRRHFSSQSGVWPDPYTPAGSLDGKITTSELAKDLKMLAIWGRANGVAFNAKEFLAKHPQWEWQKYCLDDRPEQPWTQFSADDKPN
ncbi:MAG: peptidase C45 [Candidatus Parabeggiatoa sp. nov. 1]|nr:MAG: peptidase C45 [Gammaproteobacteria bacterium]